MFNRGTSEWISRVNRKHSELNQLGLSADQTATLDRWMENEFVYSTLKLEGADASRKLIAEIVLPRSGSTTVGENEKGAKQLLNSLRMVSSLARASGKQAELTTGLLLNLHSESGAAFRSSAGDTTRVPKPPAPEHLPALLESACLWYLAESFVELNPIEQASIVLLRLIDLQPFEQTNERTALVAASLFTLRSDLPPIIIKPDMVTIYRTALNEGTRMNTKPMVETIAEAVERSLSEMIEEAGKKK